MEHPFAFRSLFLILMRQRHHFVNKIMDSFVQIGYLADLIAVVGFVGARGRHRCAVVQRISFTYHGPGTDSVSFGFVSFLYAHWTVVARETKFEFSSRRFS